MHKLRRVHSSNDKYVTSRNSLVEDLFQNNKLEYVNILNITYNENRLLPIVLGRNI